VRGRARRVSMRLYARSVSAARKGLINAGVPTAMPQAIRPAWAWRMPSSCTTSAAAAVSCPYTLHLGSWACGGRWWQHDCRDSGRQQQCAGPGLAGSSHWHMRGPVSGGGAAGSAPGLSEGGGRTPTCHIMTHSALGSMPEWRPGLT
jgi:hypothetical protein